MTPRAASILVFLVQWLVNVGRVCPTIFADDTPETVAVALGLGVAHPPGDPLLALAGHLWLALPAGNPALRLNLLSALLSAMAAALCARIAMRLFNDEIIPTAAAAIVTMFLFTFNPILAQQAATAKGASYQANFVLLLLFSLASLQNRPAAAGLAAGLLASHHWMTFAALLPAMTVPLATASLASRNAARTAVVIALAFLLGASMTLSIPVCAARKPAINWGEAATLGRFMDHVMRRPYLKTEMKGTGRSWVRQGLGGATTLVAQAGVAGTALALVGACAIRSTHPVVLAAAAAAVAVPWAAATFYFDLRSDLMQLLGVFLLPCWLAIALLAACGGAWLATLRRPAAGLLWTLPLVLHIFLQAPAVRLYATDRATWSFDIGRILLAPLPPRAGIIVISDLDTFPLWYLQQVDGFRRDVLVVNRVLLNHAWYREQVEAASGVPGLGKLDGGAAVRALVQSRPGRNWFTVAGPVEDLPRGMFAVPFHLSLRLARSPGPAVPPRGVSLRGTYERVRHLPEPSAALTSGYIMEVFYNLGLAASR